MVDQKKIGKKIQIAVLAIFVVFMPLGSWYYLQSGFSYHEKLMSALKNYGELPEFNLFTQNNETVTKADFFGKIIIAGFYKENNRSTELSTDYARRILGQFESQKDLLFLFHHLNPTEQNDSTLKAFATQEYLLDKRAFFLAGDEEQMTNLLTSGYKFPSMVEKKEDQSISFKTDIEILPDDYPFLVLVDSSLTIRNYYNLNDEKSMDRLVEHLAIILPREKKSKAVHVPEKEK